MRTAVTDPGGGGLAGNAGLPACFQSLTRLLALLRGTGGTERECTSTAMSLPMSKPHLRSIKSESLGGGAQTSGVFRVPQVIPSGNPGCQALIYQNRKRHIASSRALQVFFSQRNPVHQTQDQKKPVLSNSPPLTNRTGGGVLVELAPAGLGVSGPRGSGAVLRQKATHSGPPVRGAVAPSARTFLTAPWDGLETLQREFLKCFPALPGLPAALSHVQVGSRTDTELGQREQSRARRGAPGLAVRAERGPPRGWGLPSGPEPARRPAPPRPLRPTRPPARPQLRDHGALAEEEACWPSAARC